MIFPHYLIKLFQATKDVDGNGSVKNIETKTNENKLIIILEFHKYISIKSFSDSLTEQRTQGSGDLCQFLKDNYDAIRIIGNLIICEIEDDKLNPILNFEKDIVPEYSTKGIDKLNIKVKLEEKLLPKIAYLLYYKSI